MFATVGEPHLFGASGCARVCPRRAAKPGPTAGVQGGRGVGGSVLPVTHLRLGIVQRVHRVVHLHVGGGLYLGLRHRLTAEPSPPRPDDAERALCRWSVRLSCGSPVYLLSGAKAHPLSWASAPPAGHSVVMGGGPVSAPLARAAPGVQGVESRATHNPRMGFAQTGVVSCTPWQIRRDPAQRPYQGRPGESLLMLPARHPILIILTPVTAA